MGRQMIAGSMTLTLIFFCGTTFGQGAIGPSGPGSGNVVNDDQAKEMVDNPQFKAWFNFKVGATVKYKTTTTAGPMASSAEQTHTLKEATAEKIVVEVKTATTFQGKGKPMENIFKMEIPVRIAKNSLPENLPDCKMTRKGDEEVKIGDKTYKCEWKEMETTHGDGDKKFVARQKVWTCKEVPGGLVKMEMTSGGSGENAPKSEVKTELVEFKAGE
ncbi:MAG: hypothetical protein HZA50_12525 [Planctomycetes bacterium]|nr:hypothetical protein [Planctomycetota bacterium]